MVGFSQTHLDLIIRIIYPFSPAVKSPKCLLYVHIRVSTYSQGTTEHVKCQSSLLSHPTRMKRTHLHGHRLHTNYILPPNHRVLWAESEVIFRTCTKSVCLSVCQCGTVGFSALNWKKGETDRQSDSNGNIILPLCSVNYNLNLRQQLSSNTIYFSLNVSYTCIFFNWL